MASTDGSDEGEIMMYPLMGEIFALFVKKTFLGKLSSLSLVVIIKK